MQQRFIEEDARPSTMKVVTHLRYPKQIEFSDKFIRQLEAEYSRLKHTDIEDSTNRPIAKYKEKFIKAVNFYLSHL